MTQIVSRSSCAPATSPQPGIGQGLDFLETAFRNGQPPVSVASALGSLFPRAVLEWLGSHGADAVSNEIQRVMPQSPLGTFAGRKFMRELVDAIAMQLK